MLCLSLFTFQGLLSFIPWSAFVVQLNYWQGAAFTSWMRLTCKWKNWKIAKGEQRLLRFCDAEACRLSGKHSHAVIIRKPIHPAAQNVKMCLISCKRNEMNNLASLWNPKEKEWRTTWADQTNLGAENGPSPSVNLMICLIKTTPSPCVAWSSKLFRVSPCNPTASVVPHHVTSRSMAWGDRAQPFCTPHNFHPFAPLLCNDRSACNIPSLHMTNKMFWYIFKSCKYTLKHYINKNCKYFSLPSQLTSTTKRYQLFLIGNCHLITSDRSVSLPKQSKLTIPCSSLFCLDRSVRRFFRILGQGQATQYGWDTQLHTRWSCPCWRPVPNRLNEWGWSQLWYNMFAVTSE